MIKDFKTYINEGLFDRNQSEFTIRKTDRGVEQVYFPKTKKELYSYIDLDIEQAKKDGTYPDVNLNNIDISELGNVELEGLFSEDAYMINPDISDWNIKSIPYSFFDGNEKIEEFTIPNSVTSIGDNAFRNCRSLKSVIIHNNVKSIEGGAFYHCGSLKYVTIPDSVTIIGSFTFSGCRELTSVTIGNSVTSIGNWAFGYCVGLESVVIPSSVESIGNLAFYGCTKLSSVEIPDSVTSIGNWAFYECSNLKYVTISNNCCIESKSFPRDCKIIRK